VAILVKLIAQDSGDDDERADDKKKHIAAGHGRFPSSLVAGRAGTANRACRISLDTSLYLKNRTRAPKRPVVFRWIRGGKNGFKKMSQTTASSSIQSSTGSFPATLDRFAPYVLSILRILAGLLFLEHGMSKLLAWPQPLPTPPMFALIWCAGMIEMIGGTLVAVGLLTRLAAFVMSGEMAFAYFMSHAPRASFPILNGGEAAILFCFIFFYLVFAGAGPLSLDALVWRKR
jgi:putative oxidoreductase